MIATRIERGAACARDAQPSANSAMMATSAAARARAAAREGFGAEPPVAGQIAIGGHIRRATER
ncbi:MAG: hypothetical protein Tsb0020_33730 [Haliangiales bacterium]